VTSVAGQRWSVSALVSVRKVALENSRYLKVNH
jgi:hypothetical protein